LRGEVADWVATLGWVFSFQKKYNPDDETNENAVVLGDYVLNEKIVGTESEDAEASGWYAKSDIVKGIGIECPPLTASYGAQYTLLQYDP
jgi:hypothetical protein